MDKLTCDIIKDLLPLYVDGAASEASQRMVEDHIDSCEGCRRELNRLTESVAIPISKREAEREAEFLYKIKRKFQTGKIKTAVLSVLTMLLITVGFYCLTVLHTWIIPYDGSLVDMEYENGSLYAEFKGDNYYGTYGYGDDTGVVIDGEEKRIYIMCYEENLFSKYIDPLLGREVRDRDRRWTIFDRDSDFSYDIVYYGDVADIRRTEPYTEEELEEMVVLWEKPAGAGE